MTVSDATKDERDRPAHRLGRWLWRRVKVWSVIFLIYALSIGPMYWQWFESKYNEQGVFWGLFYEPLFWLGNRCPPLAYAVDYYVTTFWV